MTDATTAPAPNEEEIPLFEARYRWVLRRTLAPLRRTVGVDLDHPEQMAAAFGMLSTLVQQAVRKRKLEDKLDPAVVAVLAGNELSTASEALLKWAREEEDVADSPRRDDPPGPERDRTG